MPLYGEDGASTLSMQPIPLETQVAYLRRGDRTNTGLARTWRARDIAHCHLCPGGCSATYCDDGNDELVVCLKLVPWRVEKADAPLFADATTATGRTAALRITDIIDAKPGSAAGSFA